MSPISAVLAFRRHPLEYCPRCDRLLNSSGEVSFCANCDMLDVAALVPRCDDCGMQLTVGVDGEISCCVCPPSSSPLPAGERG